MKLKHFFFLACLLALHASVNSNVVEIPGMTAAETVTFIEECLITGFATAGLLQDSAIVSTKFSRCDTADCATLAAVHSFKVASFQTNALSLCQGQGMLQASLLVKEVLGISTETIIAVLDTIEIASDICQAVFDSCFDSILNVRDNTLIILEDGTEIPACANFQYRAIDGYCNNVVNLEYGTPFRPFARLLPPDYDDGIDAPRGSITHNLPNPRLVSLTLSDTTASTIPQIVTQMVKVWGQFLDHDLTRTPESSGGMNSHGDTLILECCEEGELIESELEFQECRPIEIPEADHFFEDRNTECLPFVRSAPADGGCRFGPRQQTNEVTGFLDASNVYGSTPEEEYNLRNFINGNLAHTDTFEIETLTCLATIPLVFLPEGNNDPEPNFRAGDTRVNEQPSLAALHTIWMRIHNLIADKLTLTESLDDETTFQETRKLVIALMQHISYNEFLPLVIGERFMNAFQLNSLIANRFNDMYKPFLNPTIFNVFGTAAYRFGHTLITDQMAGLIPFELGQTFFQSGSFLVNELTHPSSILEQEARMQALPTDVLLDDVLTTRLALAAPEDTLAGFPDHGNDLMALNIQRGRDHGIPGYNAWRKFCGLKEIACFDDLEKVMVPETAQALYSLYNNVDDIDLFPAGMGELPAEGGGILGPTFSCIIALQFNHLKFGDRFFYENSAFIHNNNRDIPFSGSQLTIIKGTTFAELLCQVTCAASYPENVFLFDELQAERDCSDSSLLFAFLDLGIWI